MWVLWLLEIDLCYWSDPFWMDERCLERLTFIWPELHHVGWLVVNGMCWNSVANWKFLEVALFERGKIFWVLRMVVNTRNTGEIWGWLMRVKNKTSINQQLHNNKCIVDGVSSFFMLWVTIFLCPLRPLGWSTDWKLET